MSETPKAKATANPNRTTAKKAAVKKAVIADSTNKDKPVKKAPAKKAPVKKAPVKTAEQVLETVVKDVVETVKANPQVAEAIVNTVKPGLWNRIKSLFGLK